MLAPGDRFDRYIIEALLGEGGMGSVYRARDERLQRRVALKLVRRGSARGDAGAEEAAARLLREARAAAAFTHPNVIAVHDVGEVDGTPFIAMELVSGQTLRVRMAEALPVATRIAWLADIARALSAAHRAGLVHRDVKPDNVLIADDGAVKVLDFGIARRALGAASPAEAGLGTITAEGAVLGTPLYMAPEQLENRALDGRTDQFAWGVVAYELLAGRPPWDLGSGFSLIAAILTRTPEPLGALAPAPVEAVVLRALRKDPAERFASMDDIVEALDAALGRAPARAAASGAASPGPAASISAEAETMPARTPALTDTAPALGAAATSSLPRAPALTDTAPALGAEATSSPPRPAPALTPARRWTRAAAGAAAILTSALLLFGLRGRAWGPEPRPSDTANRAPASPRPTAVTDLPVPTSTSAEALAAYAAAMRAQRDGADPDPLLRHATELDPALAAAHLRLSMKFGGIGTPKRARESYRRAVHHRDNLSERDRALLDAMDPFVARDPPDLVEWERRMTALVDRWPLDVELLEELALVNWVRGRIRANEGLSQRILQADPRHVRAWHALGAVRTYQGDIAGAHAAFDECLRIVPGAMRCMEQRIHTDGELGDCAGVEGLARRMTIADPEAPAGYAALARALAARGRPAGAVLEALKQSWERVPVAGRRQTELEDTMRLALLGGDFERARAIAADLGRMLEAVGDEPPHADLARALVELEVEIGQPAEAARVAGDFLGRRDAWARSVFVEDYAFARDAVPRLLAAERRAGVLSTPAFDARRAEWLAGWDAKLEGEYRGLLWLHGFADIAETREEADEALAAQARFPALGPHRPETLADAQVGRVYLLAGRAAEAAPLLARGAAHCRVLDEAVEHTRAHALLGQAREALGDKPGACAAYRVVLGRWGQAKPRSLTADGARVRAKALGCEP
jgi:serine/threonine-protein kinase